MSPRAPRGAHPDDLDELLRRAAPVANRDVATPGVRRAIGEMARAAAERPGHTMPAEAEPARLPDGALRHRRAAAARRRRKVVGVSLASAVWALSATGLAAAGGYALYSGFVDSSDSTESVQAEEYVNVGSPAFGDAFDQIAARYPLPAGFDYDVLYRNVVAAGGLKQLTGTAGEVAHFSSCAWARAWVQAHDAGDIAAQRSAVAGLERAATSSDLAAIDGGGVIDSVTAVATAAAEADADAVAGYASPLNCSALSQ